MWKMKNFEYNSPYSLRIKLKKDVSLSTETSRKIQKKPEPPRSLKCQPTEHSAPFKITSWDLRWMLSENNKAYLTNALLGLELFCL